VGAAAAFTAVAAFRTSLKNVKVPVLVLLQPGTAPSPARFLGLTLELMTQVILELGVFFFKA
jgi:hypothetical protein